jgi:hypothetical protein
MGVDEQQRSSQAFGQEVAQSDRVGGAGAAVDADNDRSIR